MELWYYYLSINGDVKHRYGPFADSGEAQSHFDSRWKSKPSILGPKDTIDVQFFYEPQLVRDRYGNVECG